MFQVKEMVFAKLRGYNYWPAIISDIIKNQKKVKYKVTFMGDFSYCFLDNINIKKWSNDLEKKLNKKNIKLKNSIKMAKRIINGESSIEKEFNLIKKIEIDYIEKNRFKIIKFFKNNCLKIFEKIKNEKQKETLDSIIDLKNYLTQNNDDILYSVLIKEKLTYLIIYIYEKVDISNKYYYDIEKELKEILNYFSKYLEDKIIKENLLDLKSELEKINNIQNNSNKYENKMKKKLKKIIYNNYNLNEKNCEINSNLIFEFYKKNFKNFNKFNNELSNLINLLNFKNIVNNLFNEDEINFDLMNKILNIN